MVIYIYMVLPPLSGKEFLLMTMRWHCQSSIKKLYKSHSLYLQNTLDMIPVLSPIKCIFVHSIENDTTEGYAAYSALSLLAYTQVYLISTKTTIKEVFSNM